MRKVFLYILIHLVSLPAISSPPDEDNTFSISGIVIDSESSEPLPGVVVWLHETYQSTATDSEGKFTLTNIKPGTYHLHTQLLGYKPFEQTIRVQGNITDLEFKLEPSHIELQEVQVEENLLKSGVEDRPLNVEVVNEDFLEKEYANTLSQTLDRLPGVTSINTGANVAKPVIRGLSSNRVIVNNRGVKQEGQQWGADHGLEIDQYDVEALEVIKGPASLLYGSDGIGGVVNILPNPIPTKGLNGEVLTFAKSLNDLIGTSVMLEGRNDWAFFHLRGTLQDYADYKVPASEFTYNTYNLPIYENRLKNTAGTEKHLTGAAGIMGNWGNVRLQISNFHQETGMFAGAIGIPRAYQLSPDGDVRNIDLPNQEVNHFSALVNSKVLWRKLWIHTDIGFQQNDRKEFSEPHTHGAGPQPEGNLAHHLLLKTITINSRLHHQFNEKWKGVAGIQGQYQKNETAGFEFLIPDYSSWNSGAFVFAEFKPSQKVTYSGGIRFDRGQLSSSQHLQPLYNGGDTIVSYEEVVPAVNRDYSSFSGSLGASWKLTPKWNLKTNIGRSFRFPAPSELVVNGVHHGTFRHEKGDPNMKPEHGYQLDLGAHYSRKTILLKLTPFFNYFDNFIYLKPTGTFSTLPDAGQIYQYSQADAIHTGFEMTLDFHPLEALHAGATAEYIWNYNLETYLPLPFTPPFTFTAEADYTFESSAAWMDEAFVGLSTGVYAAQNRVDRNEYPTPGYTLVHFNSGVILNIGRQPLHLNFKINNLLNTNYLNHLSRYRILNLPEPGRNFQLMLKLPLN